MINPKLQNYLSIFRKLFVSIDWTGELFLFIIDFNDLIKEILKFFHNDCPQVKKQKYNIHQNLDSYVIKERRKKIYFGKLSIILLFLFLFLL